MNKRTFNGRSALLKYILFSKGLKLSVTHLDMSFYYNSNVGSGLPVFRKLVLLLPYYVNSFNGTYAWVVVSLTWKNISANAMCTIFGLTAEL